MPSLYAYFRRKCPKRVDPRPQVSSASFHAMCCICYARFYSLVLLLGHVLHVLYHVLLYFATKTPRELGLNAKKQIGDADTQTTNLCELLQGTGSRIDRMTMLNPIRSLHALQCKPNIYHA